MAQSTNTDVEPLLSSEKQLPVSQLHLRTIRRNSEKPNRFSMNRMAVMFLAMLILTLMRVSLAAGLFHRQSDTHHDHLATTIEKRVNKILKSTPLIGMYSVNCVMMYYSLQYG